MGFRIELYILRAFGVHIAGEFLSDFASAVVEQHIFRIPIYTLSKYRRRALLVGTMMVGCFVFFFHFLVCYYEYPWTVSISRNFSGHSQVDKGTIYFSLTDRQTFERVMHETIESRYAHAWLSEMALTSP